jgi:DNA-binding response OmpR family regulator
MTEDFDVFEAGNGAEAMQKAREGLYDLVILDVGCPIPTGASCAADAQAGREMPDPDADRP